MFHLFFEGVQGISPDGRRDRLEFTSVVFHWRNPDERADDLVSVTYSLNAGSGGEGGSLIREERPLTTTPPGSYGGPVTILNGVTEVLFSYLDKEKREKNTWSTRASNNETVLPAAVRVTLKIKRGEREREVSALFSIPLGIRPAEEEAAAGETGAPGGS